MVSLQEGVGNDRRPDAQIAPAAESFPGGVWDLPVVRVDIDYRRKCRILLCGDVE
jgi:hypothetical protein